MYLVSPVDIHVGGLQDLLNLGRIVIVASIVQLLSQLVLKWSEYNTNETLYTNVIDEIK